MFLRSHRAAYQVLLLSAFTVSAFGCSSAPSEDNSAASDPLSSEPAVSLAGPTAAQLLAKVTSCNQISKGKYKTDDETGATIAVCDKKGAVFWKADMDIDCDGQRTTKCNEKTDPWYQNDTRWRQSNGKPLNAETLPYVVVPSSSSIWDFSKSGIQGGGVVAVIYNNQVLYAVVGDSGPEKIIGEASYATAKALGIDPDPATGGADTGVTYIVFKNSKVSPIESHAKATELGQTLAQKFIDEN